MSLNGKRNSTRSWGLLALSAVATILAAATIDPDANWLRLRAMPRQERQRLVDNLQKFDLVYTAEQQRALRDLDRKINELDPDRQEQYVMALRRYHNWLNQLPEMKQGELKEKAPDDRMALVKTLVADHPVTQNSNSVFLQFVDVGDHSPFELAAIYQIWRALSPSERQQIEKAAPGSRRQNLFTKAERKKIAFIPKPSAADEEQWTLVYRTWVKAKRPGLLKLLENDAEGPAIELRQAINFHFLEMKKQIKAVTSEHLAEFLASFPPWLQSSFDHYPPDEARRRLTVVYRLVFPAGSEIKAGPAAPAASKGARSKPAPPVVAPSPADKTSPAPAPPPT